MTELQKTKLQIAEEFVTKGNELATEYHRAKYNLEDIDKRIKALNGPEDIGISLSPRFSIGQEYSVNMSYEQLGVDLSTIYPLIVRKLMADREAAVKKVEDIRLELETKYWS